MALCAELTRFPRQLASGMSINEMENLRELHAIFFPPGTDWGAYISIVSTVLFLELKKKKIDKVKLR